MRILDAHCHVFPDAIAVRGTEAVARFYEKPAPPMVASLETVLGTQQAAGIDLTILCTAATAPYQVRPINQFMAQCVELSGGRCLALGHSTRTVKIWQGTLTIFSLWDYWALSSTRICRDLP